MNKFIIQLQDMYCSVQTTKTEKNRKKRNRKKSIPIKNKQKDNLEILLRNKKNPETSKQSIGWKIKYESCTCSKLNI